ncbi:MAG: PilW family protein [Proteobacteria bacterium]|nr:PilW family protein [Pseudomonadota bacterium]
MIKCQKKTIPGQQGFTLVELIIGIAIGSIILGSIYSVYASQQKIYNKNKQVVATQQNLRTCMYLLEQDIKQACLDPLQTANPKILTANRNAFEFQMDLDGNGHDFTNIDPNDQDSAKSGDDKNEKVLFYLIPDENDDGIADAFPSQLIRATWGNASAMADYIQVINFVYRDRNNTVLTPPFDNANIRVVEVTLIARSEKPDPKYLDNKIYTNLNGDFLINANDHYYRRSLSKVIRLRNL